MSLFLCLSWFFFFFLGGGWGWGWGWGWYCQNEGSDLLHTTRLCLYIVCIWCFFNSTPLHSVQVKRALGYQPPLKNSSPHFFTSSLLNLQIVQTTLYRQFSPYLYIVFLWTPLKNRIFEWTLIILRFVIVNSIPSFKSN